MRDFIVSGSRLVRDWSSSPCTENLSLSFSADCSAALKRNAATLATSWHFTRRSYGSMLFATLYAIPLSRADFPSREGLYHQVNVGDEHGRLKNEEECCVGGASFCGCFCPDCAVLLASISLKQKSKAKLFPVSLDCPIWRIRLLYSLWSAVFTPSYHAYDVGRYLDAV